MRRALAIAGVVCLALPGVGLANEDRPTRNELESELICPTCKSTLDQSNAPVADRMREVIDERIKAGDSKSEIKDGFVDQFGPAVLAAPPKRGFDLVAWLLPLVGLGAGIIAVSALAWRWSRSPRERDHPEPEPELNGRARLEPVLERRLDDELARFDA